MAPPDSYSDVMKLHSTFTTFCAANSELCQLLDAETHQMVMDVAWKIVEGDSDIPYGVATTNHFAFMIKRYGGHVLRNAAVGDALETFDNELDPSIIAAGAHLGAYRKSPSMSVPNSSPEKRPLTNEDPTAGHEPPTPEDVDGCDEVDSDLDLPKQGGVPPSDHAETDEEYPGLVHIRRVKRSTSRYPHKSRERGGGSSPVSDLTLPFASLADLVHMLQEIASRRRAYRGPFDDFMKDLRLVNDLSESGGIVHGMNAKIALGVDGWFEQRGSIIDCVLGVASQMSGLGGQT